MSNNSHYKLCRKQLMERANKGPEFIPTWTEGTSAKDKAIAIRKLISSQPPEVIHALSDGVTFDDEFSSCCSDIHEAISEMFACNGYPENKKLKNQKIYSSFQLPDMKVDIAVSGEDGEEEFEWEFSK